MATPTAPDPWVVPNNPSLTQTLRTTFESLRGWMRRQADYIASAVVYTDTQVNKEVPIGTVRMTASVLDESTDGWFELDGGTLINAQTIYPVLYARVPTGWKSGANINLPDMRSRYPIDGTAAQVGNFLGSNQTTLSTGNLPAHSHPINLTTGTENQAHNHNPGSGAQFSNFTPFGGAQNFGAGGNAFPGSTTTNTENQAHNHNINSNTDNTGSGTPFDTYPASMYLKFVIRVI